MSWTEDRSCRTDTPTHAGRELLRCVHKNRYIQMRRPTQRRVGAICAHVCAATESVHDVEDEEARQQRLHLAYCAEGTQRALRLENRGPMRLGPDKKLHPDILGAPPDHEQPVAPRSLVRFPPNRKQLTRCACSWPQRSTRRRAFT